MRPCSLFRALGRTHEPQWNQGPSLGLWRCVVSFYDAQRAARIRDEITEPWSDECERLEDEVGRLREDNDRLRHALRLIADGSQHAASIATVALRPESTQQGASNAER